MRLEIFDLLLNRSRICMASCKFTPKKRHFFLNLSVRIAMKEYLLFQKL